MRIKILRAYIAVVLLTALIFPQLLAANNITLPKLSSNEKRKQSSDEKSLRGISTQTVKINESGEQSAAIDCCPIVEEKTEPIGGKNPEGRYVELYRESDRVQQFYEKSCRPDVFNKPCRFIRQRYFKQSRCVQKYSYSYAITKLPEETLNTENENKLNSTSYKRFSTPYNDSKWVLDHILVRSGCSCEILP